LMQSREQPWHVHITGFMENLLKQYFVCDASLEAVTGLMNEGVVRLCDTLARISEQGAEVNIWRQFGAPLPGSAHLLNPYALHTMRAVHCKLHLEAVCCCVFFSHVLLYEHLQSRKVLVVVQVISLAVSEPTRGTCSQLLRKPLCFA